MLRLLDGGEKVVHRPTVTPPTIVTPALPERLDNSTVQSGMRAAQPRVSACYARFHVPGNALVHAVIARSGRIESAKVGGALAGTPTGECVERAVKGATFEPFHGQPLSIDYPFILR